MCAPSGALLCALLLCASPLCAQHKAQPDTATFLLPQVDVAVTRTPRPLSRIPASISVITRAEIQNARAAVSLEEPLLAVPGVTVANRYDYSQGIRLSIRGFGARAAFGVRGVRIIADGIPLTMPDGQSALNNIDLASAERIEVIRGPASVLYGNASGGVVSIETEEPSPGFAGEVRGMVGSYGSDKLANFRKAEIKFGDQLTRGSYLLSASRLLVDGYRDFSSSRQNMVNLKARYSITPATYITGLINAIDQPLAQSPGSLPMDSVNRNPEMAWGRNVATGSGKSTQQMQGGLRIVHDHGRARGDLIVYGVTRNLDNPLTFGFIQIDRTDAGTRGTVTARPSVLGKELTIIAGADSEMLRDARTERNNVSGAPGDTLRKDQLDQVASFGPFLEVTAPVVDRIEATAGLRYDAVAFKTTDHQLADGDNSGTRTLTSLSPVFGLLYAVNGSTGLYGNVGTSFQTPTTTELINAPPAANERCCKGGFNTSLEPQRGTTYEVGLKTQSRRIRAEVAAFTTRVRSELVQYRIAGIDDRDFFRNAGVSRHRGLEFGAAALLPMSTVLEASYTISSFHFVNDGLTGATNGNRIPGIPVHHLFGRLRHERTNVFGEVQTDYSSAVFTTDANDASARNPGHTVIDFKTGIRTRLGRFGLSPFVSVNNIFDVRYNGSVVLNAAQGRYYEPAPGRNLYLGIGVPFVRSGANPHAQRR